MSARSFNDAQRPSSDLKQLAPLFRQAVEAAIAECQTAGLDAVVYEAYRSQQLQAQYYARGRTVIPPTETVTNAPTNLHSWHGYGLAVDVISRKKGWSAGDQWFVAVADIFRKHDCKWGGDWKQRDLPHFQWHRCKASPSDEARKLVTTVGIPAVWQAVGAVANDTAVLPHADSRIAVVTASALNLRADPSTNKPPIRVLERGTELEVLNPQGSWFAVRADGVTGYVHGDMIALRGTAAADTRSLGGDGDLRAAPLRARQQLPVQPGDATRQRAVTAWNRYGGLLSPLSKSIGIAPACGVAVLCVESGGSG
ncbi:MAG TPA: M15 family metallopeptidase, partial [Longimicrobiales bacterium]